MPDDVNDSVHENLLLPSDPQQYASVWKSLISREFEASLGEIDEALVIDAGELRSNDAMGAKRRRLVAGCSAFADSRFRVKQACP